MLCKECKRLLLLQDLLLQRNSCMRGTKEHLTSDLNGLRPGTAALEAPGGSPYTGGSPAPACQATHARVPQLHFAVAHF